MHKRLTHAAIDEPSEETIFGPLTPEQAFEQRRIKVLWARRLLKLDARGQRIAVAVAVALDAERLLVRVVDAAKGSAAWMPADHVLVDAQARAWIAAGGFSE